MSIVGLLLAVGAPALPGARCRGRAHLFDEPEPGEPAEQVDQRHAQALGLCQHCPSLTASAAWLASLPARHRPAGVVAGRTYHRNPKNLRAKAEQP
ncbi:MAG: WhiB family transcriptional regulator, redox-sensing transcriptional regulator [Actinomycetota bacterium]|nr:WhiB family transcriptional regulator, redox-sensing transcriptional regulator [Actinomycetota bacterium]